MAIPGNFRKDITDSLQGDALAGIRRFDLGYINPGKVSFKYRACNVSCGAVLGFISIPGQILRIFQEAIKKDGKPGEAGKRLLQTALIVPAGLFLSVVFTAHYLGVELPKHFYKNYVTVNKPVVV